ncbi:Zinc finger protein [Plakobranchus ocellatus]|uniref:Zinc finger protein n=1 Tax=Plakobranchus ocellatus TaxID=259542 RepID=A0AAV3Y4P6_9GAST|nr:Zinc finger protein [Plakobranchus ocellatus]
MILHWIVADADPSEPQDLSKIPSSESDLSMQILDQDVDISEGRQHFRVEAWAKEDSFSLESPDDGSLIVDCVDIQTTLQLQGGADSFLNELRHIFSCVFLSTNVISRQLLTPQWHQIGQCRNLSRISLLCLARFADLTFTPAVSELSASTRSPNTDR